MLEKKLLEGEKFSLVIKRLGYQLIETHGDFANSVIVGVQPRGVLLANSLYKVLTDILQKNILFGKVDITLFRDDFHKASKLQTPKVTDIAFDIENKKVVLVDDVLYTGRTIRAAMEALLAYGRPSRIELLSLVDRRFARDLPIKSDYTGIEVDTISSQRVKVYFSETLCDGSVSLVSGQL